MEEGERMTYTQREINHLFEESVFDAIVEMVDNAWINW
jgi:hypothetical protein